MMTRWIFPAGLLLLAACSGSEADKAAPADDSAATDQASAPPRDAAKMGEESAANADELARWNEDRGYEPDPAAPPLEGVEPGIGSGDQTIPAAIRGRWALDAADCSKRPGTDLTALVIDAANLRFHESHGELARVRERDASRIVADYKFSGEGMEWDRLMVLDAQRGDTLIRRDYGEGAAPGPIRYTRCKA